MDIPPELGWSAVVFIAKLAAKVGQIRKSARLGNFSGRKRRCLKQPFRIPQTGVIDKFRGSAIHIAAHGAVYVGHILAAYFPEFFQPQRKVFRIAYALAGVGKPIGHVSGKRGNKCVFYLPV